MTLTETTRKAIFDEFGGEDRVSDSGQRMLDQIAFWAAMNEHNNLGVAMALDTLIVKLQIVRGKMAE